MQWLELSDIEQIVRLVGEAADPRVERTVPERRRMLLEGMALLVNADVWYWATAVLNPEIPGDSMATSIVDGGWIDHEERARFFHLLSDPQFRFAQARATEISRHHHVTFGRDLMTAATDQRKLDKILEQRGFGHFLVSSYPLGNNALSGIALYRRCGQPPFTERDRLIVHIITSQVDWLHDHGNDVPARDKVLQLSRREREVMAFLMGGDSLKEVAQKLQLSEHTVGDYVKRIYKRFGVNSRAELLARFIAGGQH